MLNAHRTRARWTLTFLLYFSLVAILPAHAYIDPNSGSMVLQILIGALLGAGVALKLGWRKLIGLFRRKSKVG